MTDEQPNISPARRQFAEDLRNLADVLEANQDIDVLIVSYRLAREGEHEYTDPYFIEGVFFDEQTVTTTELRQQSQSISRTVDDYVEAAMRLRRPPEIA